MKTKDLSLFSMAKITANEILIEEQLENLGIIRYRFFKRYLYHQKSLRRKIISLKIIDSLIFGILPIVPLLTYFQVLDFIDQGIFPVELILFTGSILFGIYFLLQFFNFFLMAMLNTNRIISGRIFEWFETLPIPREKLRKLVILTIIRSLDVPLIVITASLPIVMLIGTQNIVIFFWSIAISILITIFSLSVLISFNERINRILDINEIISKRTLAFRLINLMIYLIIIIGSFFLIQWALSSMNSMFIWFGNSGFPPIIIIILSLIPFPIAPGALLSSFIAPTQVPLQIWFTIIIGFIVFIILTYVMYRKSRIGLEYTAYSKFRFVKKGLLEKKKPIRIKVQHSVIAYIRKDIATASREIKSFLSITMPILFGFIFTFTFNLVSIQNISPIDIRFTTNWFVFIGFNIITSGMIVYGILNIEQSGTTILASSPLIPREQAKAKLFLMLLIQTITVLAPSLLYIGTLRFIDSLFMALRTLPFTLLLMLLMFELRVYFFGKFKNSYAIEEVFPERRISKWIFIFFIEYLILNFIFTYALLFHITERFIEMGIFFIVSLFLGLTGAILIFDSMFPLTRFSKNLNKGIWFSKHSWITIVLLIIIHILIAYLFNLIPLPGSPDMLTYEMEKLIYLILLNSGYCFFWFIIVPKILKIPNGKTSIGKYLESIGLGWVKSISKYTLWGVFSIFLVGFLTSLILYASGFLLLHINDTLFEILRLLSIIFWHEIAFRGVILTMLLKKYNQWKAITFNVLINLFSVLFYFFVFVYNPLLVNIVEILLSSLNLLLIFLVLSYLFIKTRNLFPGLIAVSTLFLLLPSTSIIPIISHYGFVII